MLKLWLLKKIGYVEWEEDFALVVVAESASGARRVAAGNHPRSDWLNAEIVSRDEVDLSIPSVVLTANKGS